MVEPDSGRVAWGNTRRLFFPRDRGHSLVLPIEPSAAALDRWVDDGPLLEINFFGWRKSIYRPLLRAVEEAGYVPGDLDRPNATSNFYFFSYDWRATNLVAAAKLHDQLNALAEAEPNRPLQVALICQSNAARVCRFLAKSLPARAEPRDARSINDLPDPTGNPDSSSMKSETAGRYQVSKLVLVGASNGGALRILRELNEGRRYVPFVGRYWGPETLFAIRPLFDDLPFGAGVFVDLEGKPLDVDLVDSAAWTDHEWAIFQPKVQRRLSRKSAPIFGDREAQQRYLSKRLEAATELQHQLARKSKGFGDTDYYLITNGSLDTPARAVLERRNGRWVTHFPGDRRLRKLGQLSKSLVEPGDGHATLSSQRDLSAEESAAVRREVQVDGGHFTVILREETHRAILDFLAEEWVAPRPVATGVHPTPREDPAQRRSP